MTYEDKLDIIVKAIFDAILILDRKNGYKKLTEKKQEKRISIQHKPFP